MERGLVKERRNWQKIVEKQGFIFHSVEGKYWDESACYAFRKPEMEAIEQATQTLFDMCMEAVEAVLHQRRLREFAIPDLYHERIRESWDADEPTLYGRFDLGYHDGQIKLLEFNADTPTSLLEASVVQWHWLQDFENTLDQFNAIHELLLEQFAYFKQRGIFDLYFACATDNDEDYMTVAYLMDCAQQAGLQIQYIDISDIGWADEKMQFVDLYNEPIRTCFKLYPWEFMLNEDFGRHTLSTDTCWVEPFWKMLLSNKAILKILWELYPEHPLLLACHDKPGRMRSYVQKPLLSREGANVTIVEHGRLLQATQGEYGYEGYIYQDYFELPEFMGNRPVIGSWIVGDTPAGIGIRETTGLIHDNLARFVPHYFY
ncbi:MAG TPA: glutathionylspermidine synthase family protein [Saprospiraceae bacterium]|nr:glutathionylspermidine synthase family protein [Saprospiraceae bacterium]HMP23817.1 glutathionylspermidine synthase family protein [Saprospiraceae bacterium]